MRPIESKVCNTSIYIVCEGSNSEPWFLRRFIECVEERFGRDYEYHIYPTPKSQDEAKEEDKKNAIKRKSKRKTSGRKVNIGNGKIPVDNTEETLKAGNPLHWVMHGREKLKSHSEVYVVFDKDGHPKMKDAFQLASQPLDDGRKVKVILNSRSFEYYMLLHFESIYRAFDKTECGEKKNTHTRYFHCCLPNSVEGKACQGDICINGYARSKGYWTDSKDQHTFVCARNIWLGMKRGEDVRSMALSLNPTQEIYNLNPYVEFQELLARLLNMNVLRHGDCVSKDSGRPNEPQIISRNKDMIDVKNGSSVLTMRFDEGWIKYFEYPMDIQNFQIFKESFKPQKEAEDAYAEKQFKKRIVKKESALNIAAKSSLSIPIWKSENDNTFGILYFGNHSYLIF